MKSKPAIRIAVTNKCNLNCQYCPKDGDSYLINNRLLTLDEFTRIIDISNQLGFSSYSLTGGEPLVVPNITFPLAKHIKNYQILSYLKLNTNGVFLNKFIQELSDTGFNQIKVSIDIINPNSDKTTSHYHSNVTPVLNGINQIIQKKIPVRLQVVVTKQNVDQLEDIIQFCIQTKIDLKLFDLTYYQDSLSKNQNFWKDNYISFNSLSKKLQKRYGKFKKVQAVGGYGHPNKVFTVNKTKIMLRDTEISAYYAPTCKQCSNYMCQDGLCNITLSSDGRLKLCRPKGIDLGLNLLDQNQKLKTDKQISTIFTKALDQFKQAKQTKRNFDQLNLPPLGK